MLKNNLIVLAILGVMASGCATGEIVSVQTPSGLPEASFSNTTVAAVTAKFADRCVSSGFAIEMPNPGQIVCTKALQGLRAAGVYMVLGSKADNPAEALQLLAYQSGADVHAQVRHWIQVDAYSGQTKRSQIDDPTSINNAQQMLFNIGGHQP